MSIKEQLSIIAKRKDGTMTKKEEKKIAAEMTLQGKGWDELTTDEKIERIREQVKERTTNQGREISRLREKIESLERHDHKDGKVMVELNRFGGSIGPCESVDSNRKIYF